MQSHEIGESGTWIKVELDTQESSYKSIDGSNLEVMAGKCGVQGPVQSLELYEPTWQVTNDMSGPLRCRLCASPNTEMVDIVNSYGTNDVLEKIEYCLRIVVRETDVLPKRICQLCLGELEVCYRFQKSVAEAEEKLLDFFRQTCGKLKTENNFQTSSLCIGQHGVTECDEIGETFNTPPNLEEVRTTNTTPKSNRLPACLKPCSVMLVPIEVTDLNDIKKGRRNSSDVKPPNLGQESAPEIDQAVANGLEVSRITAKRSRTNASKTFSSRYWERFEHVLTKQENLEIRETGHTRKKRVFRCKLCPKSFMSRGSLKRHKKTSTAHTGNKEEFKCSSCPKIFMSEQSLTGHNKIHTGLGLYGCDFCEKKFVKKLYRDRHYLVHTGERPFNCSLCEKAFARPDAYRRHLATVHSDLRMYPCPLCDKSFKLLIGRKRHMAVHADNKQTKLWQCDYCKTDFRRKDHLLHHMRICEKLFRSQ